MGWFSNRSTNKKLGWAAITSVDQLKNFLAQSDKPLVLFKHSTRCSISSMALNRLENDWQLESDAVHLGFIDLIQYRDVSNFCAEQLKVQHQSPQLILIENGWVKYHASHQGIQYDDLIKQL
jgi:bacillithiol system protein YtxJ